MCNKFRTRPFAVLVMTAAMLLQGTAAGAGASGPGQAGSGSLFVRTGDAYRAATAVNTDVHMSISGLVARVAVRQEFENGGGEWAEGVYVFPLPDRAAVDHMRLYVGERHIEGEIREKETARRAYEQAKSAGRKTSLLEQQRPNVFTASIANIGPGERVVVEIEYLEDLVYRNGTFSLRFPTTLTPRYMPGTPLPDRKGSGWSADTSRVDDASLISPPTVTASGAHRLAMRIDLDAGLPLESIVSRYHPVNVVENAGRYAIELVNPSTQTDHDFALEWKPAAGSAPQALSFAESVGGEEHLLLMLMPPSTGSSAATRMPREMVFIIDRSGSMHGTSIRQAKMALIRALKRLQGGDRFNVIAFSNAPRRLFERSAPADAARLAAAQRFVSGLQANGGTEMQAALALALDSPAPETHLRQLVFITDGAVGNEDELFRMVDRRLRHGRLFTVGIGSAPNGWFMRKAAELGRGTHTTISALAEVGEKMDQLFEAIEQPRVTDISIDWPSGVIVDAYPERVPDLYSSRPVAVKARIRGVLRDSDVIAIRGDTAAGAWQREIAVGHARQSPGVAALWAGARIEALNDAAIRGADAGEIRAGIVTTALRYHLVSRHTSLVAVDRTPARPPGDPLRSDALASLVAYGQSSRAIFGFPATGTGSRRMQATGAACLLLAALLAACRRRRRYESLVPAR